MSSTVTNASAPTETGWQRFQRDRTPVIALWFLSASPPSALVRRS